LPPFVWLTFLLGTWQAAIDEGVVVGGGCCLLRLSKKVDGIKALLDNEEQKVSFHSTNFYKSCFNFFVLSCIFVLAV